MGAHSLIRAATVGSKTSSPSRGKAESISQNEAFFSQRLTGKPEKSVGNLGSKTEAQGGSTVKRFVVVVVVVVVVTILLSICATSGCTRVGAAR